jgi:Bacterial membrane protein YfhO
MKKGWLKIALPHIIAVAVFLIVALLFCKPALEGKVLNQHDIVGAQAMAHGAWDYKDKHGHLPLWNTNLFSGMPNYQVAVEGPGILVNFTAILTLGLPKPISFFFLACICFYLLMVAFRVNPYIGIFAALSFAYASYDPIIISAGHDTKMLAISYMPALLAGLVWIYHRRYWLGLATAALFASMEIMANHPQINYYFFICAAFMTISYLIIWIRRGEYKHAIIALSLALVCGLIGIGNSAVTFFTTADYAKYTMRGGKTIEATPDGKIVEKKTTGLDEDYAFSYSIRKSEAVMMYMPDAFGTSSSETFAENEKFIDGLADKNIPAQVAGQLPKYWGGVVEGFGGPVYLGIISCILFIIGLVVLKAHHRWWILAAVALAIMMAWGKYFEGFNQFLLHNLPMYDKFRAPYMSLVIPQMLVPLLAALTLHQLFFDTRTEEENKLLTKRVLYAVGGLIVLTGLIYIMNDYNSDIDKTIIQQAGEDAGRSVVNLMKDARKSMFSSGLMRLLGYSILVLGLLFLWRKKIIPAIAVVLVFMFINTIDLVYTGKKYLNEDNYVEADSYTQTNFQASPFDQQLLQDKDPHFRVYALNPERFMSSPMTARTIYYHRSLGGYHPAKLRIYQDLIENQLSKQQFNMPVLNMLDTKYFIIPDEKGDGIVSIQKNETALGAAWFVKELKGVNGPAEEMRALDSFDAKKTAFFDSKLQKLTAQTFADSIENKGSSITLTKYDNDTIEYNAMAVGNQFAVFSEIYYPAGWNAYLDGKKTDYYKVNYLLRGMPVPAGNHKISFIFEPASYKKSYQLALWSGILLYIFLIGGILLTVLDYRRNHTIRTVK